MSTDTNIPTPRTDAASFMIFEGIAHRGEIVVPAAECEKLERELAQAKADLAAARKDSERLDWVEANIDTVTYDTWSGVTGSGVIVEKFKHGGGMVGYKEGNLRAAIDAAMEGGER